MPKKKQVNFPTQPAKNSKYPKIEIHHVSISAGDATVIAVRDDVKKKEVTTRVLIDSGNSLGDLQTVQTYCSGATIKKKMTNSEKKKVTEYGFDKIIVSHFHQDHLGGLPLHPILAKTGTTVYAGKSVDGKLQGLIAYSGVTHQQVSVSNNKPYTIDLDTKGDVQLICYCAGGVVMDGSKPNGMATDENDMSLAWLLTYDDFRYFTAGDLSGSYAGGYRDVERDLISVLKNTNGALNKSKQIDVMKATHHGSKFSMFGVSPTQKGSSEPDPDGNKESEFLDQLQPQTIVVPCQNNIPLPPPEFFQRVQGKVPKVYLANVFIRTQDPLLAKPLILSKTEKQHWTNRSETNIVDTTNRGGQAIYTNIKKDLVSKKDMLPVVLVEVPEASNSGKATTEALYILNYDKKMRVFGVQRAQSKLLPPEIPRWFLNEGDDSKTCPLEDVMEALTIEGFQSINKMYVDSNNTLGYSLKDISLDGLKTFEILDAVTGFSDLLQGASITMRSVKRHNYSDVKRRKPWNPKKRKRGEDVQQYYENWVDEMIEHAKELKRMKYI